MITQLRLLSKILFGVSVLSSVAMAQESFCPKDFSILERGKGRNYSFQNKTLDKLYCKNSFEGQYFKIVYATEEEAIRFDNKNEAILKKAANVYYHLMVARDFWVNEIKSSYVQDLPQITVRIDITNAYSSTRHYKNEEQIKNYNNAWSVPAGETPKFVKDKLKWGKEIWFSPMKKLESSKLIESRGDNPIHQSLLLVKEPIVQFSTNALIFQALNLTVASSINTTQLLTDAISRVGTIAIVLGLTEATKYMDKIFISKWHYVDTAMVPEIIYHEYAHIAMSDTMKTVHSVPVIEGMADYFATAIANRRKMYESIKDISQNKHKDAENKSLYHPYLEGEWNATSDYSLSLLWRGRMEFEKFNKKRASLGHGDLINYNQMVFDAHFNLNENSTILKDLTSALIEACKRKCENTRAGIDVLHNVFEMKGMN